MNFLPSTLAIIILFPAMTLAQKKPGGKTGGNATPASAPAASVTPASPAGAGQSGATQIEQGYHYHLAAKTFMKYFYTDTKTDTTTSPTKPATVEIVNVTKNAYLCFDSFTCKKGCVDAAVTTQKQCVDYDPSFLLNDCCAQKYITRITTTTIVDSMYRYADRHLRVSVAQGDSGKLTLGILQSWIPEKEQTVGFTGEVSTEDTIAQKTYDGYEHSALLLRPADQLNNLYLRVKPKVQFRDPTYFIKLHYTAWQTGVLTIPYKYRFGGRHFQNARDSTITVPNDATNNINVALSGGFRFGGTRFYYDQSKSHNTWAGMVALFAGPAIISVSSTNTVHASASSNEVGLSTGGGMMLQLKNINFGAFLGVDIPFSSAGQDWYYANKVWLGFGIGLNLAMFTVGSHQSL